MRPIERSPRTALWVVPRGVPFTVKANVDLVGLPTTMGLKAAADAYPDRDAPVVERLRRRRGSRSDTRTAHDHRAVAHGQRALGRHDQSVDRSRTPGASSGGEAAAVATGMSPLGLGNDESRIPSSGRPSAAGSPR